MTASRHAWRYPGLILKRIKLGWLALIRVELCWIGFSIDAKRSDDETKEVLS